MKTRRIRLVVGGAVVAVMAAAVVLTAPVKPVQAAPVALVQVSTVHEVGSGSGNGGTTNAVSLNATTAGDFLVVAYQFIAASGSVTGSVNQSFSKSIEKTQPNGGTQGTGVWYRANIPGGAMTVTLTTTAAADSAIVLLEYSGVATTSPADGTAVGASFYNPGGANKSSGNMTSTQTGDLIVGAYGDWGTSTSNQSIADGKASRVSHIGSGVSDLIVSDLLSSTSLTNSAAFTISPVFSKNVPYGVVVAAFKAAPPPLPVARFTFSPASPHTGQPVNFDGSTSSCSATPCTYNWTDDDCGPPCNQLGTGVTMTYTFQGAGTKHVRLTVTDALTRTNSVEHDVVVTVAAGLLTWRPPTLTNPITVALCNCNIVGGQIIVTLNTGQDYILTDSVVLTYPVVITGGHNVDWIGGEIRPTTAPDLGIQLMQNVGQGGGTIHLEGIYLDGVLTDGIVGGEWANEYKPAGTVADANLQLENIRIEALSGDSTVNHQDCIQQYGGWLNLRVDRFTCKTLYQGFMLPWEDSAANNRGLLSHWDIRNSNLHDAPNPTDGGMQTLIHFGDQGDGSFDATSHQQTGNLSNVYLHATVTSLDNETYPNSGSHSSDGTVVHSTINPDGTIAWANSWAIPGFITNSDPPGGDYVPLGVAGLNYVSPGYQ